MKPFAIALMAIIISVPALACEEACHADKQDQIEDASQIDVEELVKDATAEEELSIPWRVNSRPAKKESLQIVAPCPDGETCIPFKVKRKTRR